MRWVMLGCSTLVINCSHKRGLLDYSRRNNPAFKWLGVRQDTTGVDDCINGMHSGLGSTSTSGVQVGFGLTTARHTHRAQRTLHVHQEGCSRRALEVTSHPPTFTINTVRPLSPCSLFRRIVQATVGNQQLPREKYGPRERGRRYVDATPPHLGAGLDVSLHQLSLDVHNALQGKRSHELNHPVGARERWRRARIQSPTSCTNILRMVCGRGIVGKKNTTCVQREVCRL